jgi:hypothetical protein
MAFLAMFDSCAAAEEFLSRTSSSGMSMAKHSRRVETRNRQSSDVRDASVPSVAPGTPPDSLARCSSNCAGFTDAGT